VGGLKEKYFLVKKFYYVEKYFWNLSNVLRINLFWSCILISWANGFEFYEIDQINRNQNKTMDESTNFSANINCESTNPTFRSYFYHCWLSIISKSDKSLFNSLNTFRSKIIISQKHWAVQFYQTFWHLCDHRLGVAKFFEAQNKLILVLPKEKQIISFFGFRLDLRSDLKYPQSLYHCYRVPHLKR
jgi:hypothetical protein